MHVTSVNALEILDSRGQPTLQVTLTSGHGARFVAGVPAGASTGWREAKERRDGDPHRYAGRGVQQAAHAVNGPIAALLAGRRDWPSLAELDEAVRALDGSADKSEFGANAIAGVSMAAARAFAAEHGEPLFRYLAPAGVTPRLPVPHFNVLNGGAHAGTRLEFQEFMIAPVGAACLPEAIQAGAEVYAALHRRLAREHLSTGLGDEGGFAPNLDSVERVCELLVDAITDAGYPAGPDGVMVALDPAAHGFYDSHGQYRLHGLVTSATELVDLYEHLIDRYPIWSIEDGCAEDDDDGWRELTDRLAQRVQLVGDDLFVTDAATIAAAAARQVATAALIKVNQVGTVTETLAALDTCRRHRYGAMISHRSGETVDAFIADLAVASGCGQLKSGAPARGERVTKYNRLLEIAAENPSLPFGLPDRTRLH
jgi:enolase